MTYTQAIEAIPANTTTGEGKGLTISLLKALAHATVIQAADANEYLSMPVDVRLGEIKAIATHLDADHLIDPPAASTAFNARLAQIRLIGTSIANEADAWDEPTARSNLSLLTDRIMTICLLMDTELGGITAAQTGDRL